MPGEASARAVLVVDDEVILGRSVKRMLARDYQVTLATSAHEALALFASGISFDLILCDLMMPEMDGPACLQRLRALPETQAIPVLFMTAKVQTAEIDRYLAMGAAGVIRKPFDPMTLAQDVRSLLEAAEKRRAK